MGFTNKRHHNRTRLYIRYIYYKIWGLRYKLELLGWSWLFQTFESASGSWFHYDSRIALFQIRSPFNVVLQLDSTCIPLRSWLVDVRYLFVAFVSFVSFVVTPCVQLGCWYGLLVVASSSYWQCSHRYHSSRFRVSSLWWASGCDDTIPLCALPL